MKDRIKTLVLTGLVIAVITSIVTLGITLFNKQTFDVIHLSNILFTEFLILLSLSILILFKQQFLFKSKAQREESQSNSSDRLNSSLEFLLLALPLLIISGFLLLFN